MTVVLTEEERTEINNKIIDLLVELGYWELIDDAPTDSPQLHSTLPLISEIPEIVK